MRFSSPLVQLALVLLSSSSSSTTTTDAFTVESPANARRGGRPTSSSLLHGNAAGIVTRSQFLASSVATASTASAAYVSNSEEDLELTRKMIVTRMKTEEDLELTRQIILEHMRKTEGMVEEDDDDDVVIEAIRDEAQEDRGAAAAASEGGDRPENDLMIRAAMGETVEKTPVWLFRQAGRHLPEYREYKEKTNRNFLQLLASPESVAECTMQPIRRYDLDAAILFSDILVVPEALGIEVTMPGGVGIQVPNPLRSPQDAKDRLPSIDDITADFVRDRLRHVLTAVREIRTQMTREGKSVPLIGFSAAPWTLLFYMVGGSSKKNQEIGVTWLREHPEASSDLLRLLTKIVVEYMSAQVQSGAHLIQVFEAMGMMIDDDNFVEFALPCLEEIGAAMKRRHPDVPLMVFARGACQMNDRVAGLGYYDVVTIDGSVDRGAARRVVGDGVTLQGNYDPAELIEENGKTVESVRRSARELLEELGPQKLIANLGEGLGGKESPVLVDAFVNAIHQESAAIISGVEQSALPTAASKEKVAAAAAS